MNDLLLVAASLFTLVVLVTVAAFAARRILGIQVGLVRALLAGVVGYLAANLLVGATPPGTAAFASVSLGVGLLVAMTLLFVAEFFRPTGTVPGPVEAVRAARARFARAQRYAQISRIAVRHGLGRYLRSGRGPGGAPNRAELARSLRLALQEGGVTFVKLGQLLSTRSDLLPTEFTTELAGLQHDVPPAQWPQVQRLMRDELGRSMEEVFAEFEDEPMAAASIAQVHAARLHIADGGQRVVVKVQRPDARVAVERDLDIVWRLARTLRARTAWGRSLGVVELADGFATALREELDFRVEARNLDAVTAATTARGAGDLVRLPGRHERLCTQRVLVMDRLEGVPLGEADALISERGLERDALARLLLAELLRQVMLDGVFHADPHPGNVLLLDDDSLALLDFGSVGRIDLQLRAALQDLLLAIDRGDPAAMRDGLLELCSRPDEIDEQRLERALGQFAARHLGPGTAPDIAMFTDLFRLLARYGLAVPPEAAAVFRALATLEGTLAQLAPGFNIVVESRRFAAQELALRTLHPSSLRQTATDELVAMLPVLRRLPRRFDRITAALEQGRLGVNVRLFADDRDRRVVTGLLNQLLLTIVGAVTGIMAVLLLGTTGGPAVTQDITLLQLLGYNLLVISCVIGLRVLFTIAGPPR